MLVAGQRYLVTKDMFNTSGDVFLETNMNPKCFSGYNFAMCLTERDLLQLIRNCNNLEGGEFHLKKDWVIEVDAVEYNENNSIHHDIEPTVSYIEFHVFSKNDKGEYLWHQNGRSWNYIREEFLTKISSLNQLVIPLVLE